MKSTKQELNLRLIRGAISIDPSFGVALSEKFGEECYGTGLLSCDPNRATGQLNKILIQKSEEVITWCGLNKSSDRFSQ